MAIISDNLSDLVEVYEYQKIILNYLEAHEAEFGIPAEWHFHPTAHGKGTCDGIWANLKRNAALRKKILRSKEMYLIDSISLYQKIRYPI